MTTTIPASGFDFHCHADLFPDPTGMIAACNRRRIVTLAVTTTPKAWTQNRRWTAASSFVHAAVGLHPEVVVERHGEIGLLEDLQSACASVFAGARRGSRRDRPT